MAQTFHTTDTRFASRSGQTVEVVGPLDETKYDREETGPMFVVRFEDGTEADAFADEIQES